MSTPNEVFNCCGRLFSIEKLKRSMIDSLGNYSRVCTDCANGNTASVPDVFIDPKASGVMYEENIADPKTGKPIPFYDKASKLAAMKQAGVREAGDRVGGMRNENTKRRTYFV